MTDLATIPTQELRANRAETVADIDVCTLALRVGVLHYSGDGDVKRRLGVNRAILAKIDAEFARRGEVVL